MFAGRVTVETREIIARTMGEFESLDEMRNVVVARDSHRLVYLRDVATVEDSHEEARVLTRFNGENCVKLSILKQAEANTVEVARLVKARLEGLRGQLPADIEFGVVENQGDYVMAAINSVINSVVVAAILVIVITYVFLGHWRQTVVMIIALPLTFVANFLVMKVANFSLNVFSLGGLVVAMGVILDNSIVAVENITRLYRQGEANSSLRAMDEIGSALFAATLSYLALFLPFLLVPGLVSLLFRELVMAIAGIVVLSLVIALTITPLLTDRVLRKGAKQPRGSGVGQALGALNARLAEGYGRALRIVLKLRWVCVFLAVCLLAVGFLVARQVGSEFFPELDDGRVMVKVRMPAGTAIGEMDRILREIENTIAGDRDVESYFTLAGGKVWGLYTYEIAHEGEVDIQLVPKSKRRVSTDQYINKIRPLVSKIPVSGGKIAVMHMKIKGIRQIGEQQVEVKIKGTDLISIFEFAKKVAGKLAATDGLTGVGISMDMTKPEYRVYVDRARASAVGIPVREVAETLRSLVHGEVSTQYRDGSEYYNIRVMVPETRITGKRDLEQLVLQNDEGKQFYLREIAEVRQAVGPVEIVREDQAKEVIVRADSAGISVGEAIRRAQQAVLTLDQPAGVYFEMGGQAQMMADMRRTAGLVLIFAVFFAFVVLAVQFESLKLPLVILGCLPFCLAGMVYGLYAGGLAIGATVAIGLLIVVAAHVNDGVLLLTFAEELREQRAGSPLDTTLTAAKVRFRPRVMTTVTTIAGFVPLALNLGEGGDLLQPMAVAAIGGLVFEIFVALFVMPSVYLILESRRGGWRER
jgi:multidrug efflux pump subunit AcrB